MKKDYLKFVLVALLVGIMYIPTFVWMWGRWFAEESYYSHGILIPFVVVFLILFKKDEIASAASRPRNDTGRNKPRNDTGRNKPCNDTGRNKPRNDMRWVGLALIILSLVMHLGSALMKVYFTSGLSLILLVLGLVLYFMGPVYFKALFYPVMFLVFMVPMPMVLIANASVKLKLFAAQAATVLLNKIGLAAVRDGSTIRTLHSYMVVEAPCSGLRSLISLLALGALVAYFMKTSIIKKWVLVILSIPIAISANIFRVSLLTAASEIYGEKFAMGWFHDFSGFLLFFVALLGLMVTKKMLESGV